MGCDEAGLRLLDIVVAGGVQMQVVTAEEVGRIVLVDAAGGVEVQERNVLLGTDFLLMGHVLGQLLHVGDLVAVVLTEALWHALQLGGIQHLVLQDRYGQRTEEEDLGFRGGLANLYHFFKNKIIKHLSF